MGLASIQDYSRMIGAARSGGFALPGIAVSSSETINGALRGFAVAKSDGILQVSPATARYASGSAGGSMVRGAIGLGVYAAAVAAQYEVSVALHIDHCPPELVDTFLLPLIEESKQTVDSTGFPLFHSFMFDGSSLPTRDNLRLAASLLERTSQFGFVLEIEVGVIRGYGAETTVAATQMTDPSEFVLVAEWLGERQLENVFFAPAFGNVHGGTSSVGSAIDVSVLSRGQEAVRDLLGSDSTLLLSFHGGSSAGPGQIAEAIEAGVVKFNVDTATQYAYTEAVVSYVAAHRDSMVGESGRSANKASFDPRSYSLAAEVAMGERVSQTCEKLGSAGRSTSLRR